MIIDTSAIVAILLGEAESDPFAHLLTATTSLAISAVTLHEASIVMAGKVGRNGVELLDDFLRELAIEIVGVAAEDAIAAREAYFKFGRGYHPAGLNLADCFVYALAKARNETLLFKGDDFSATDIVPAWPARS